MTAATIKQPDRRIQRTRQLLFQAFSEVVREKGVTAFSVQDITERANVNRGTFYAHFADKYALLEVFAREDFRHYLLEKLPPSPDGNQRHDLQQLIVHILAYFKTTHAPCRSPEQTSPMVVKALREEIYAILLYWLQQRGGEQHWRVPIETIANAMSWAIFGAINQIRQTKPHSSLEQIASELQIVMLDGVAQLAQEARNHQQRDQNA